MRNSYNNTEKISLKNYLRADPHTQLYKLNGKDLVTEEMFWGTSSDSLYLHYTEIDGRSIKVSDGISDYNAQTKEELECDDWLKNNLFNIKSNVLYVIQGYAGCGKTTLMKSIIKENAQSNSLCYIDIGEKWKYEREPNLFFVETVHTFMNCLQNIFEKSNWEEIWDRFISLAKDTNVETFDSSIRSLVSPLKSIIKNYKSDTNAVEHPNNELPIKDIITDIDSLLYERFNISPVEQQKDKIFNINENPQNQGQVGVIISLLMLLNCADAIVNKEENKPCIIVYDNLDVITNPAIPAEMVLSLWITMSNYIKYIEKFSDNNVSMPNFAIYIAVRKVLFAHITEYLPKLEQNSSQDLSCAHVCDVSELYLSKKILEHRINYWMNHECVADETKMKLQELNKITAVMGKAEYYEADDEYYTPKPAIDLDGLFNHNFRACANMLAEFLEDGSYSKIITEVFENSKTADWQKTSTLVFAISSIYRKLKIWNRYGFRCKGFDTSTYPTTLFRLILTYLYVSKVGYKLNVEYPGREGMPDDEYVSLGNIIELMNKVPFIRINIRDTESLIEKNYNKASGENMSEDIVSLLSEMCLPGNSMINPTSQGYGDDDELWRRPIYFVGGVRLAHTAASYNELRQYFLRCTQREGMSDTIRFSITDEGCIIVSDFIASFEFYSARYNIGSHAKPLHQVNSIPELKEIIQSVLDAISLCCQRQIVFMKEYIKSYNKEYTDDKKKNIYLKEYFHPRTNPRFREELGIRHLANESFRPQLHIVRVIYNHIAYLNEVKNLFAKNKKFCICIEITKYIKYYLNLYKKTFYDLLENTDSRYNNTVYDDLVLLYKHQKKIYDNGQKENIDITRKNKELLTQLREKK